MSKTILEYRRPEPPGKVEGRDAGWASCMLAISGIVLGIFSLAYHAVVPLAIALSMSVYSIIVSKGRSIGGWIGLAISGSYACLLLWMAVIGW